MSFLSKIADIGGKLDAALPDPGDLFEAACDKLGLPEAVGDVASLVANGTSGNWLGVAADVADLAENAADELEDAPAGKSPGDQDLRPFEWLLPEERPRCATYSASADDYVFTDGHFER